MAVLIGAAGTSATANASPNAPRGGSAFSAFAADTDSVARDTTRRDTLPQDTLPQDTLPQDTLPQDTLPRDTLRRDTLPPDSLSGDTIPRDTLERAARQERDTGEGERTVFPDPDSTFNRLAGLQGFRIVEYRGRNVELAVKEEAVRLRGEAQAKYATSVLEADTISYLAGLQFIRAQSNVSLAAEGQSGTTDSIVYYDVSSLKGTIMDARTSFAEAGAEWYVRGDATLRGERTVFVEAGSFTTCDLEEPHYYFKAGKIKVVTENVIVAWPVTLYINGVPIAWLPFFAQDIRPGRRSGFLPPRFGVNDIVSTSGNVRRQISDFGYYFAINEFMDSQLTIDWFSGQYTRLNGAFRYRDLKKYLRGNVRTSYSFGDQGNTFELSANHQQELSPVTDLRLNANFIQNTKLFEERSFDPREQTQRITSDFGLNHRFPFAALSLSARRNQSLGTQRGRTELTLPDLRLSFSPLTLFRAPRTRAGAFNNMTLSGGLSFRRRGENNEEAEDRLTTDASANASLSIGALGLGGGTTLNTVRTTPFDSVAAPPPPFSRALINYNGSLNYQVDLIGSTTFRPTLSIASAAFRSPDTNEKFVSAPTRLSFGATLSTDLYGFLPGFGPFSRIRHKLSPRFQYAYSPEVTVDDSLLTIPGFPGSASGEQNTLSLTLNQTFEAKVREDVVLDEEERELLEDEDEEEPSPSTPEEGAEGEPGAGETPEEPGGAEVTPEDEGAEAAGEPGQEPGQEPLEEATPGDSLAAAPGQAGARGRPSSQTSRPRAQQRPQQRNVVLLGINSSALRWDFARKEGPKLVSETWSHRINSDLLRGLALNFSLDLFKGAGTEREFSPILSDLTGSFTFSSARGLGGILGLGRTGSSSRFDPGRRIRQGVDSRYRLQSFDENPDPRDPGMRRGGPWNLSLTYSLRRAREEESGTERQNLSAILSLQPTPNWRLQWRTSYNITDKEFGEHLVTLDRDLHRWMASFVFARSPNGNFLFSLSVRLRDAPDLKFDYDQQSVDR